MSPRFLKFLQRWLINTLAVLVAVKLLPGVNCDRPRDLFLASLLLGVFNTALKPLLMLVALPLVISTLGLFIVVINAALLYLVAQIVPTFQIGSFWLALAAAVIISLVSVLANLFLGGYNSKLEVRWRQNRPPAGRAPGGNGPVIDV